MMRRPPDRQLYPALMQLPNATPEERADIQRRAHQRMLAGSRRLSTTMARMTAAMGRGDLRSMQDAVEPLRDALGLFESGLATQRALAAGQAPRDLAMQWFKREMNLADVTASPLPHGVFGLSSFHYLAMAVLALFAVLASWMYVARARRVTALLASLRSGGSLVDGGALDVSTGPRALAAGPSAAVRAGPPTRAPVGVTGNWAGELRIARIFEETPTVKTFRLAPLEPLAPLPFLFEPGQFMTITVVVDGKPVRRSYSIASSPGCAGWCDITVKHEPGGVVSGYLHDRVKAGDRISASGPYGRFTFRGHEAPSVVFIAGGVGITPLMSSIRYLTDQSWDGRIDLLYACARLEAVIFRDELERLVRRHHNLHVTIVLNDEPSSSWTGPRGYITDAILAQVPDIRSRRIHLCGPPVMMDAVKKALSSLGIAADSVRTELFLSPTPARVQSPADETAPATCSFARSQKSAPLLTGQTVLECAESVDVHIEYACRQGFCGVCKVRLLAGTVDMEVQDGLTPADRASGLILACQATSSAAVTVDA